MLLRNCAFVGIILAGVSAGACGSGGSSGDGTGLGGGISLGSGGGIGVSMGGSGSTAGNGSGASAGLDSSNACTSTSVEGERVPVDLYFMVDTTGSMNCPVPD